MAGHIVVDIELGDDRVPSSHGKWEMAITTLATSSWLFAYVCLASWQFLKSQSPNKQTPNPSQAKPKLVAAFNLMKICVLTMKIHGHSHRLLPSRCPCLWPARGRQVLSTPVLPMWCPWHQLMIPGECDGGRRKLMEHYPRRGLWWLQGVGRGAEVIGRHRTAYFIKIPFPCLVSGPDLNSCGEKYVWADK